MAIKQSLNWVFIEIDTSNKTTYNNKDRNKLPFANSEGLYKKNASSYSRNLPKYYTDEIDHKIKGFSKIIKEHWYFKVGHTTDITTGIYYSTEVYYNIIDIGQQTSYDEAILQSTL